MSHFLKITKSILAIFMVNAILIADFALIVHFAKYFNYFNMTQTTDIVPGNPQLGDTTNTQIILQLYKMDQVQLRVDKNQKQLENNLIETNVLIQEFREILDKELLVLTKTKLLHYK